MGPRNFKVALTIAENCTTAHVTFAEKTAKELGEGEREREKLY